MLAASITIAAALGSVVGALAGAALMRSEPATSIERTVTANALNTTLTQLSADLSSLKAALDSDRQDDEHAAVQDQRARRACREIASRNRAEDRASPGDAEIARASSDRRDRLDCRETAGPSADRGGLGDPRHLRRPRDGRKPPHGIYEVGPGAPLPGVGKVEAVRRQDGRWVVVTPEGPDRFGALIAERTNNSRAALNSAPLSFLRMIVAVRTEPCHILRAWIAHS